MFEEGIDEGSRAVDIYRASCALANKYGTDDQARQVIETMMLRFNAEKVRPPLNIEGPNGLLQHVHRAIDFVAANPKVAVQSPQAAEWLMARGRAMTENSLAAKMKVRSESALLGVVHPRTVSRDDDDVDAPVGHSVSANVRSALASSGSIHSASSLSNMDVPKDPDALLEEDGGEEGRRSLSDTGNGRRLIDSFGGGLRYTTGLGWFVWDRGYWRPDSEDLGVYELAKKIPPIISREIENYAESQQSDVIKWAHASRSNARLKSMVESAKSDPRISVEVNAWDNNKHLLGVANGIIDLSTGELYKGNPDIYITRRSPVSYTSGITNVKWEKFLDFATGGDKEFQDWLQRAAGYSITGLSKYDILFLVYGPPGSGKNTFVEALVKAIGTQQYAWPLDSSILASGDTNTSSTDLYHWAELRGRRMVWVDELPESERIKENAVKKLTGSSEISARSPGEKPFTFQSQAKLWISTNHRPIITDDAMWRRIRPIPFLRVPTDPDPNLKEYIFDPEGALPAVLAWAVEGAIKILGSGAGDALGWCAKVTEAADIYRKNEDRIGIFLEEETIEMEGSGIPLKNLYPIYRSWSDQRGERSMTQTTFHRKLIERNISVEGMGHRAIVVGRALSPRESIGGGSIDFSEALRRQISY
jgi:putative DNA primase/helicase